MAQPPDDQIQSWEQISRSRKYFIADFINYLTVERNLSKRTIKEYKHDLQIFFEFFAPHLAQELSLETMDERTMREFLTHLRLEKDYTPKALNRKISTLKAYFRFLEDEEYIKKSPVGRIKSVKMGKHIPRVFSKAEVESLLHTVDLDESTNFESDVEKVSDSGKNEADSDENEAVRSHQKARKGYKMPFDPFVRDKAILEMFYATGMRIAELSGLNTQDVDMDELTIKVTGKGNKQRMVIMNETARDALMAWLKIRPSSGGTAMFLSGKGKRFSIRGIQKMFQARLAQSGVKSAGSPHTMRHSFATHLLEGGADLVSIKELLGHESLSTTQIYTNIAMSRIKKVYKEAHPRK